MRTILIAISFAIAANAFADDAAHRGSAVAENHPGLNSGWTIGYSSSDGFSAGGFIHYIFGTPALHSHGITQSHDYYRHRRKASGECWNLQLPHTRGVQSLHRDIGKKLVIQIERDAVEPGDEKAYQQRYEQRLQSIEERIKEREAQAADKDMTLEDEIIELQEEEIERLQQQLRRKDLLDSIYRDRVIYYESPIYRTRTYDPYCPDDRTRYRSYRSDRGYSYLRDRTSIGSGSYEHRSYNRLPSRTQGSRTGSYGTRIRSSFGTSRSYNSFGTRSSFGWNSSIGSQNYGFGKSSSAWGSSGSSSFSSGRSGRR